MNSQEMQPTKTTGQKWVKVFLNEIEQDGIGELNTGDLKVIGYLRHTYLIERQAGDQYGDYLLKASSSNKNRAIKACLKHWVIEEASHGEALYMVLKVSGMSQELLSGQYDHFLRINNKSSTSQPSGYQWGSLFKELIKRAQTEIATKNFYSALQKMAQNDKLISMLGHLSHDENRHFELFLALIRRVEGSSELYTTMLRVQMRAIQIITNMNPKIALQLFKLGMIYNSNLRATTRTLK